MAAPFVVREPRFVLPGTKRKRSGKMRAPAPRSGLDATTFAVSDV